MSDIPLRSLNDDAVRRIAAEFWAQRPVEPPPVDPVAIADRTVAAALSDRDACPHGVAGGARVRPNHGTPGCALCRLVFVAAYRAAQEAAAPNE